VSDTYHSLRLGSDYVQRTVEKLQARILARFPDRHLGEVAGELARTVPQIHRDFDAAQGRDRRTRLLARAASAVVLVSVLVALALTLRDAVATGVGHTVDWVPLVESLVNDLVFAFIAVFFLWAVPERLQRRRVLVLLHQLRSLAHVVDMHQLDKDPEQVKPDYHPTPKSPPHNLDAEQLHHYLDYCSELLSLVAKTAALCAEQTADAVVLGTVSDLETLTAELSQKIWAKISLLPT
jgi:hypothetical protein